MDHRHKYVADINNKFKKAKIILDSKTLCVTATS